MSNLNNNQMEFFIQNIPTQTVDDEMNIVQRSQQSVAAVSSHSHEIAQYDMSSHSSFHRGYDMQSGFNVSTNRGFDLDGSSNHSNHRGLDMSVSSSHSMNRVFDSTGGSNRSLNHSMHRGFDTTGGSNRSLNHSMHNISLHSMHSHSMHNHSINRGFDTIGGSNRSINHSVHSGFDSAGGSNRSLNRFDLTKGSNRSLQSTIDETGSSHGLDLTGNSSHSLDCSMSNSSSYHSMKGDQKKQDKQSQKPKRPLSSYNFFFHHERQIILQNKPTRKEGKPRRSHGKIGFADLARSIAAKWKSLSKEERAPYDKKAAADKERYVKEMDEWKKNQMLEVTQKAASAPVQFQLFQNQVKGNHKDIYVPPKPLETPYEEGVQGMMTLMDSPMEPLDMNDVFAQNPTKLAQEQVASFNANYRQESASTGFSPRSNNFNSNYCDIDNVVNTNDFRRDDANSMDLQLQQLQLEQDGLEYQQRQRNSQNPHQLSELATQLDDESTQLLLNMFR